VRYLDGRTVEKSSSEIATKRKTSEYSKLKNANRRYKSQLIKTEHCMGGTINLTGYFFGY